MAKTEGFLSLVCDRCGKQTYAVPGNPDDQSWKTAKHAKADGTESTRYLCPECHRRFLELAQAQADEFSRFMSRADDADGI